MSESIKPFSQWSVETTDAPADPIEKLRSYTDYARTEYFKAGLLDKQVEDELRQGVENQLRADGEIAEDTAPERIAELQGRLFAPKQNVDFDADLVASYLTIEDPAGFDANRANVDLLRKYVATRKVNPDSAAELAAPVQDILKDSDLVLRAREAAVRRGDLPAVAVQFADGTRDVFTGDNDFSDEELPLIASTLTKTGALDTTDLPQLRQKTMRVYGGKSTVAENERFAEFNNALELLSKTDPEVADILAGASELSAAEYASGITPTSIKVAAKAKNVVAAVPMTVGDVLLAPLDVLRGAEPVEPSAKEILKGEMEEGRFTAPQLIAEKLQANPALRQKFSPEVIERFTNDLVTSRTKYQFDTTKPESGIRELSTGAVVIAPALLAKPELFNTALDKSTLNDDQKQIARKQREDMLEANAPEMLKLLTETDEDAASAYAAAKQSGKSNTAFLEEWMSNPDNYDGLANRAASVGRSALSAVVDPILGLAAMVSGNESAAKFASKVTAESAAARARRAELASMFGEDFGLGQQVLEALPQVGLDIALTVGTGGVGGAAARGVTAAATRAVGRAAIANTTKAFAKLGVNSLDDVTLKTLRAATAKGGALKTSDALKAVGANWIGRAAGELGTQILPVALPAFTRSASGSYVSIYDSLPESMSHEEKHKTALGSAVATGLATAAITVGMGKLGAGGPESLALTGGKKSITDLTYREAKRVYEAVKNEGKAVSDDAFRRALAAEVGGAYKNIAATVGKGVLGEAFEESLDQSINIAIEDAALKRNTPLAEKVQQVWNAGLVGGIIGGGFGVAAQAMPVSKSAETRALESRVSVLDGIAKRLSANGAPETAATVQRMMDDANAAAAEALKKDLAAEEQRTAAADNTAVWSPPVQTEFAFDDPRGVPPADTRLVDLIGERVFVEGTNLSGIAEVDSKSGEVFITLPAPTKVKGATKPATRVVLGTKFQRATGLALKPKVKTLTKATATLPAGTRTFSAGKMEYVLPSVEEVNKSRAAGKPLLVRVRDEKQRVVGLTVKSAALAANPRATTDATITDPELIREVLRLYPAPAPEPGGFALESGDQQQQLELNFNAPPEVADTETETEEDPDRLDLLPFAEDQAQLELDFDAEAPTEVKEVVSAVDALVGVDPVLRLLHGTNVSTKKFGTTVRQLSDGEWATAGADLDAAFDFVSGITETQPEVASALLQTLNPLRTKYDTGTAIRNRAARPAADPFAGTESQSPAGIEEAAPTEVAPEPTPEPPRAGPKQLDAKFFVEIDDLMAKVSARLEKAVGGRRASLAKVTPAKQIRERLAANGYSEAATPQVWVASNAVDPNNPLDIERLLAQVGWARSGGKPSPTTTEAPAATTTRADVEEWLTDEDNARSLAGKTLRDKSGSEFVIESVEIDEDGELSFVIETIPSNSVELLDLATPESFTSYLEAGAGAPAPEQGAGTGVPEAREPTEEEEEALEDAMRAQAEAEIDAGPIGQALAIVRDESDQEVDPLRDSEGDLKKAKIKSFANKLVKNGVLDDVESVLDASRDRDFDAEDTLAELETLLDEARDSAVEERIEELRSERDQTLGFTPLQGDETLRQNITDHAAELQRMLPAGFTLVADPNMAGVLGYNEITNPTAVLYNPNLIGDLTIGLHPSDARATMRTAIDHELAHAAADAVFTREGYEELAAELGNEMLTTIAETYYSLYEANPATRTALVADDRASGALPDWQIASEWVRMEQERIVNGRTSEQRMLFLRTNPTLLARFIDSLAAFVERLKARFLEQPTTGTAASISNAARQLRKLRNGGWLPAAPKADPNFGGHAAELMGALERGSDQTHFTMPVGAISAAGKAQVDGIWNRIKKRFTNLPLQFREANETRSGIMADATDISLTFEKRYKRLVKEDPSISLADVNTVLGRTAPTLDDAALAGIRKELDAYINTLPADMDGELAEEMIQTKHDELAQKARIAGNTAFRAEQVAAEQRLRNAGHGEMADLAVRFRKDIIKMTSKYPEISAVVSENEGIYLMRTYRFFNTDGWAALAAGGVQPDGTQLGMFRGREIDFGKLRENAAKSYEEDAIAEAAKDGVVLTAEQLRDRTHALLDQYLATLQKSPESFTSASSNALKKDLNRFLPKRNIDKAMLDLLGVAEDPLENALRTMNAVAKIAANHDFMRNARNMMLSSGLGSVKPSGENTVPAFGRFGNPSLSPLGELFTTPETARALQAEFGADGRTFEKNTDSLMREWGRWLGKAASFATTTKTLGSVGFYPRNVLSGQGLLLGAQGILPINRYTAKAWGAAKRAYFESRSRTEEQAAEVSRLIELQILKDDTQGRVAIDLMRGLVTNSEQDLDSLLDEFQEAAGGDPTKLKARLEAAGKKYGTTIEFLASLNNIADGAVKVQAYYFELDVLKKDAAARLEQAAQDPNPKVLAALNAELEARAADKVKDTFPSHVRQYNWVKSLNQTSVGMVIFPFVRWKTEVFRTMLNTPRLAMKEIKEGGPAERARGYRRMFGFLTTFTFGGKALGAVFAGVFGFLFGDDEEDKKPGAKDRALTPDELYALREALPAWQRSHALYTRLRGGEIQVIDITAMTPYALVTDLFNIAYEGIQAGEGVNVKRMASYVATQIIGTQIAATAADEVLNNRDDFGQPIYNETDSAAEMFGKMLGHYASSAVKPGFWDFGQRAMRSGEQDKWEIVLGEFLGARPRGHKMAEIEYRAFRGVKKMLDDGSKIKASLITGRKLDEDEVVTTLEDHQEALNRSQRKLAKVMQGLQSMGSTRGSLYGSGKNAGFSAQRLEMAERGANLRWVPNDVWLRSVYQNMTRTGEDDPMNRINLIRRTLAKEKPIYGVLE